MYIFTRSIYNVMCSYFLICQGPSIDTSALGGSGVLHALPGRCGVVPFDQNLCQI